MDWFRNLKPFGARPDNSFNYLYNYSYDQFPGQASNSAAIPTMNNKIYNYGNNNKETKKKRLSSEQLELLENSFQEETKLDPERKLKLAKVLGIQPREIAIWFQNRRARWKTKQLERLYDELKQEYDVVSSEKQKLQEEVLALKAILKEQAGKKQVFNGYSEMSWEETDHESTSIPTSNNPQQTSNNNQNNMDSNYVYNVVDDYNPVLQPYWTPLPSYQ